MYDVFLSGPISGVSNYRERFAWAKVRVHSVRPGCTVWNPCTLPDGKTYAWYMRRCCTALFESKCVVLLDGWTESPGAVAEFTLAHALKIPCVELANLKPEK